MAKTVVGLFHDTEHAQMAVRDLVDLGIPRSDISLMSRHEGEAQGLTTGTMPVDADRVDTTRTTTDESAAAGAGVGAVVGGVGGLLVGMGLLVIPGVGPILAAGPLVAALTGAALGAGVGALVGALVGMGVPEEEAEYYAEGVRRGGTLVAVNSPEDRVVEVTDVLRRHDPVDIKRQAMAWRKAGWTGYDPNAEPYTQDELDRERSTWVPPVDHDVTGVRRDVFGEGKPLREHTGATHETVHHTNVGVKEHQGVRPWTEYETDFRRDFERRWKGTSATWDKYEPVYHYGYDMAHDPRYRDRDWDDVEVDLRRDWEDRHDNLWDDVKDAVREAWNRVRGY